MKTKENKILIIGEESSVRKTTALLLGQNGHESVSQAENGEQGINMAQRQHPGLVIFSGLNLPDMEGDEAVRRIRDGEGSSVKILAASGRDQEEVEARIKAAGADGFLHKPFTVQELLDAVESLLAQKAV